MGHNLAEHLKSRQSETIQHHFLPLFLYLKVQLGIIWLRTGTAEVNWFSFEVCVHYNTTALTHSTIPFDYKVWCSGREVVGGYVMYVYLTHYSIDIHGIKMSRLIYFHCTCTFPIFPCWQCCLWEDLSAATVLVQRCLYQPSTSLLALALICCNERKVAVSVS